MEQILFVLLFVLSLLNIFLRYFSEYAHSIVWKISIATTEFGHVFAIATFVLWTIVLATRPRNRWFQSRVWMVPITTLCFLYPLASALIYETKWRHDMQTIFGPGPLDEKTWIDLHELAQFKTPADPKGYRTHNYQVVPAGDPPLTLDYYTGKPNAPLVVIVHGGGWSNGNSQQLPDLNYLLVKKGYNVASVNYSLIPRKIWPTQKNNVEAAILWMRANKDTLKFDPNKIILLGRSAGGQIAGVVANQRHDLGIVGLISYYAPTDLDFGYEVADEHDIIDSRELIRQLHGGEPSQKPEIFQDTSILKAVSGESPPTLIIHGRSDILVWYKHSERWDRALEVAGVKHYYLRLPWATHGFDFNLHGPGGQIATRSVLHFLAKLAPVP